MYTEKKTTKVAKSFELGHSKPKILSVAKPWWPTFFRDIAHAPPTLVLLRP